MDIVIREEDISLAQIGIYASISFLVVSAMGAAIYANCTRKYRLNWFEKNLLESADEKEEDTQSREALVAGTAGYNVDNINECTRPLPKAIHPGNLSPTSMKSDETTFWVPPAPSTITQQVNGKDEDSAPPTPTSPTGSLKSNTLSYNSTTSVPIARSVKHIILAMQPSRPKVASMNAKLDHTKIDTTLYSNHKKQKSTSPEEDDIALGSISVNVLYDPIAGVLSVRLIEAQNLQPREFSGTADPYAKIRLLPEKKKFYQTRIHKKTLNPIFDENFVFEERATVIERRTIEILLYDFDAYSRHVCIGGVKIPIANLDLSENIKMWLPLGKCSEQDMKIDLGDIMVSLGYLPSAERLTVSLLKARNLRIVDDTRNSSDPYVKIALIAGAKKLKKRKTGVVRNTVNPVYNESFKFDINKETLKNAIIEFTVIHDGLLGSSEILGRAIIGNSAEVRPDEKIFFDDIFRSPKATAQWVPLQEVRATTTANAATN